MKKNKGFTLIELLIVVAIIGILTAVGLGQFFTAQKRGRDTARKRALESISRALEMYYNDNSAYPTAANGVINSYNWGEMFGTTEETVYMKRLPEDPADNFQYYYESDDNGSYFKLYADIEHSQDNCFSSGNCKIEGYDNTDCANMAGEQLCNYCTASASKNYE